MRKRNLAITMAAAMAFPAVAPIVANAAIITPGEGVQTATIDVRLMNGYELAVNDKGTTDKKDDTNVFTRKEAFNDNFTDDTSDDTLKPIFGKDAKIIKTIDVNKNKDVSDDVYIIGKKAQEEVMGAEKVRYDVAQKEIAKLQEKGYTISKKETSMALTTGSFIDSSVEVIATKIVDSKPLTPIVYKFSGVEGITPEENLTELFRKVKYEIELSTDKIVGETTDAQVKGRLAKSYYDLNELKYVLETNASKFDVVKTQDGENLNIVVNKKGTEDAVVTAVLKNMRKLNKNLVVDMPKFSDIDNHWSKEEVKEAMLKGYIDASENFRPKDSITRAEFAKIVCNVFGLDTSDKYINDNKLEEPFNDVKKGDWHYNYIVSLYNFEGTKGLVIGGYDGDVFKPSNKITRQEAAKMIAAAYDKKISALGVATDKNKYENDDKFSVDLTSKGKDGIVDVKTKINDQEISRDIKTKFKDDKEIAAWADESIATLSGDGNISSLKIIGGNPDGTFKPKSEINRAEAISMLMRLEETLKPDNQ